MDKAEEDFDRNLRFLPVLDRPSISRIFNRDCSSSWQKIDVVLLGKTLPLHSNNTNIICNR